MLIRSCSLLNLLRSTNRYHTDYFYVFQIGLSKRHASILIKPKCETGFKLLLCPSLKKIIKSKGVLELKYAFVTSTQPADKEANTKVVDGPTKTKKDDLERSKEKIQLPNEQRIIELDEEKLGKLKERVLDIKPSKPPDKQQSLLELDVEKLGKIKERILDVKLSVTDNKQQQVKKEEKKAAKPDVKQTETEDISPKKVKKKVKDERSTSSLERNFITPVRAMSDFLLKPSDLESLPKTKRRSPYEFEPPITVYWRKDVEAKALEVWGSQEALQKELLKREIQRKIYEQNVFTVKRRLRDYRREMGTKTKTIQEEGLFGRSGKVVLTAIAINASNFLFKLIAWFYTGSHSMFSECIHSAADTCNQLILAYGIHKSVQNPNADHPYGYTNMKYVSSLISGVGIFCVGTGLSMYHGIHGILFPEPVEAFYWAYFTLGGSLVSEGATLLVAINSIRKGAMEKKESFRDYVLSGQDPSVNVVLMEDLAAVAGLLCASTCMGLTSYFGNPMYDAIGSLLVGGLLGVVAGFIIHTNVAALVGRSIRQENLDKINTELESDIMVRAIHDVKGIDMGNNLVRYKAELDFDGRELTRSYLDKNDLNAMLEEVRNMKDIDELEAFLLKHGENIVDLLGGEIDRIELKLKKNHPEIRHCDLEVL